MATARAIQVSVTHTALGVLMGSVIETFMPAYSASSSAAMLTFEAFVQIALNGVILVQIGPQLMADDPTFGMPFSFALFQAQPSLTNRVELLADLAKKQVSQVAQKMAPPAPAESPPTQGS